MKTTSHFVPAAALVLALAASSSFAGADLLITPDDIVITPPATGIWGTMAVTVHNIGDADSGPFDVLLNSAECDDADPGISSSSVVRSVANLSPGGSTTVDWTINIGNEIFSACADNDLMLPEADESNNYANLYHRTFDVDPGGTVAFSLPILTPENEQNTIALSAYVPVGWGVTFGENPVSVDGDHNIECVDVQVTPPAQFIGFETVMIRGEPQDGTPGVIEYRLDVRSTVVTAVVEIHPRSINLKANGNWISARIEITGDCDCSALDVDVSSVVLNDVVPAEAHPVSWGDADGDGTPDLTVKFSRQAVAGILPEGDEVEVRVTGTVGDETFAGIDHVRVIDPGGGDGWYGSTPASDGAVLHQNSPNPCNPTTCIRYYLPAAGPVTLRVYDVAGQLVRTLVDGMETPGEKLAVWYGRDHRGNQVATGVYFCRLTAPGSDATRKMLLVR